MIIVNIKKKLKNFNLDVNFSSNGEIMGLLGASGSGKSLTLKCIAGIEKPDSGRIVLNDKVLFDSEKNINLKPQDRKVGYLFQDYALFPNMTVYENIKTGIRNKEDESKIRKIIKELELEGLEEKSPLRISGGEKQRVALGRILLNKPEILLLDEPFSALDDFLKWKIELEVKSIIEKYKIESIFVSHSRDEIYRMCETISVLKEGKSEEKLPMKELFHSPKTLSAALLSGCKNFSKIKKIDTRKVLALNWGVEFEVNETIGSEDYIGVRAHFIEIIKTPEKNSFKLELIKEIDQMFSTVLMIKPPKPFGEYRDIRIELDKEKWKELKDEEELFVRIKPENIMKLKLKEDYEL